MQVLVVNPPEQSLPEGTSDLLRDIGWDITSTDDYRAAIEAADSGAIDTVILSAPHSEHASGADIDEFETLLGIIDARHMAGVVVGDRPAHRRHAAHSLIDTVDRGISFRELRGRLAMIERYHAVVKHLEGELRNVQRLKNHLSEHFQEMDEEMRLAGRLQRDFLPNIEEPVGNVQFSAVYRPASWVSGDIFDIFTIDEDRTGFYVADAVGHGMAASLLTMFIKRAIVSKRPTARGHAVLTPSETMTALNDALTEQALPNCQFVTACYGVLNNRTLTLEYARGGHPYPILITANGEVRELRTPGGLLGIFKGEEFPTLETQLRPGDKLLLYTDGVDLALPGDDGMSHAEAPLHRAVRTVASLPIQDLTAGLESQLDAAARPSEPADDVTIVGLEILRR
jgi:serine phosphatase RsbU (regulator of sigma subunit)